MGGADIVSEPVEVGAMRPHAKNAPTSRQQIDLRSSNETHTAPIRDRTSWGRGCREKKNIRKLSAERLLPMLRLEGVEAEFLRQPSAFVPRSYTLEKQLIRLVDHLFVRYPVPRFLYQVFFPSSDPFAHKHLLYRKWFAAISRGDSFRKLAHDHMTAREAALFLAAPKTDYVHRNVWWARMKAAGLPDHAIYCLLRRIFGKHDFEDPDGRVRSAITYFVRFA
jgi:hypothetical protein